MRYKYNIYNNSPTSLVLNLHIINCVSFPAPQKKIFFKLDSEIRGYHFSQSIMRAKSKVLSTGLDTERQ